MFVLINIKSAKTNLQATIMPILEKRAWLTLWSMCPPYFVYFAIQWLYAGQPSTMLQRIGLLALVATVHALGYIVGLLIIKRQQAGERLLEDERDRAIDGRATRVAYFVMLTGLIVVGVVMPFNRAGWEIVNTALLAIVLSEAVRHTLIVIGYRRPRFAH